MFRNTRARFVMAGLALTLSAAACGGETAAADTAVGQALTDELMSEADSPFSSEEDARCMSGGIVEGIGEERLEELGVTADSVSSLEEIDFDEAEAEVVVDSLFDCVDVKAEMVSQFEADFGAEGAECVADNLDDEMVRDLMASSFVGEDPEMSDDMFQAFLDIAAECDLPLS